MSLFGHTLLIAHNRMSPEPDAISIEFLGTTSNELKNYFLAAFFLIPGSYKFNFFSYIKRKYDLEDRDIWIYKIQFSSNQKKQFLKELQKIFKSNTYSYNFFTANCSYYILDLLLKSKTQKKISPFPYVLPIESVQRMKREISLENPKYIPSTQKKVLMLYKKLNKKEKKNVKSLINGTLSKKSLNLKNKKLSEAISLIIDYKIPREPEKSAQKHLFNLKKKFSGLVENKNLKTYIKTQLKLKDPTIDSHLRRLSLSYSPFSQSMNFSFAILEEDLHSTERGTKKSSYLEAMKASFHVTEDQFILENFTLFKMESILPYSFFLKPFNRLIDFSYSNWTPLTNFHSSEIVTRFGVGKSLEFYRTRLGAIPYLGFRYASLKEKNKPQMDLGFKSYLYHDFNHFMRLQITNTQYFFSPFPFNNLLEIHFLFLKAKYFSMSLSWKKWLSRKIKERFQWNLKLNL